MNELDWDIIHRPLPRITKKEVKTGSVTSQTFYCNKLVLDNNALIFTKSRSTPAVHFFKQLLGKEVISVLRRVTTKAMVGLKKQKTKNGRGEYRSVNFGYIKERGGSGAVRFHRPVPGFLEDLWPLVD